MAGLASCFGCQINITNIERHLMDVLGQIDLGYWQLTSSVPMPDEFDVAVVEALSPPRPPRWCAGCGSARSLVAVGACAVTGGIPGMAAAGGSYGAPGDVAPDAWPA